MIVRLSIMTVVSLGLLACGQNFEAKNFPASGSAPDEILKIREVGPSSPNAFSVDDGKVKEEPVIYTDGVGKVPSAYKQIHGRLKVDNFKFEFDKATRDMAISGELNFGITSEAKPLTFSMHGKMLANKSTFMKMTDDKSVLADLLKAKVTCIDENCADFFIDLAYKVEKEKAFYVVRVNNISSKEDMIEDFPTQEPKVESPKADAPKASAPAVKSESPKFEIPISEGPNFNVPKKAIEKPVTKAKPVQGKKSTTAPAPKETKKAPAVKKKVVSEAPSNVIAIWLRNNKTSEKSEDEKNNQLNVGKIRKAGEPKKEGRTKLIRKSTVQQKLTPQTKSVNTPKQNETAQKDIAQKVSKTELAPVTVEDGTGTPDESVLEDSETKEIRGVADSQLTPSDIIEMFPELKEEKKKADLSLAEQRKKAGVPTPQEFTGPSYLKSLGGSKNLSQSVRDILISLPFGENQAVQVASRNKARIQRRLQNGVNLVPFVEQLGPQSGLRILHPQQNNFWGTTELVATVIRIGQWVVDNVGSVPLDVADLSDQNGGLQINPKTKARTHRSHQHGLDVDLGYLIDSHNKGGRMRVPSMKSDDFLIDKQWELFKELFEEDIAQQIYVSSPVKRAICRHLKQTNQLKQPEIVQYSNRIAVVAGHENHFHLRIKCGPNQKLCGPEVKVRPAPCR